MACKGNCSKHEYEGSPCGMYKGLVKKCQVCDLFINWEGLRCPCCNYLLRLKPRNKNRALARIKHRSQIKSTIPK